MYLNTNRNHSQLKPLLRRETLGFIVSANPALKLFSLVFTFDASIKNFNAGISINIGLRYQSFCDHSRNFAYVNSLKDL